MTDSYDNVLSEIAGLVDEARRRAARSLNSIMTATYWRIGRRIVEVEQGGQERAEYGGALLKRLAVDLTRRFGRGFSERNLEQMRGLYLAWPISQTLSAKSLAGPPPFRLSWSHYVHLLRVSDAAARAFYETQALRGGWTVRQLQRQIGSNFFERTQLAKDRAAVRALGRSRLPEDAVSPDEEVKDPYIMRRRGICGAGCA